MNMTVSKISTDRGKKELPSNGIKATKEGGHGAQDRGDGIKCQARFLPERQQLS